MLVVGLAVTGQAIAQALLRRGIEVVAADDAPTPATREAAADLGIDLLAAPESPDHWRSAVDGVVAVFPSPGVPDHHAVFWTAREAGVPVLSELDLARMWDDRPVLAITGTNGKTTVTTLVTNMLEASGRKAAAVGNTEVPLVAALDDEAIEIFVVEASSFRLAHTASFTPSVATWLNFGPDHQDAHASLLAYEQAKARIWTEQANGDTAIGNAEDPVVARHLATAPGRRVTFGLEVGDYRVSGDDLVVLRGEVIVRAFELWRAFPHDLTNSLAAAATALAGGASLDGVRTALRSFTGLHHRVELVAEHEGVTWFDDSKATAPHATLAAVRCFESVVLIAGGRNKGLDLSVLRAEAPRLRGVVAIGEAGPEVVDVFRGQANCPVVAAASMEAAVEAAGELAQPGDAVLLSPACASFDWYRSYSERGDDFARRVRAHLQRED